MRFQRPWLTSIRYRLVVMFVSITAGAILVIYSYVVPQLESSLTSEKIDALRSDATTYGRTLENTIGGEVNARQLDLLTRRIAERTDSSVTVFGIPRDELDPTNLGSSPPYVISDSRQGTGRLEPAADTVLSAAREGKVKTTTESQGGKKLAQVAKPLFDRGEPAEVVVFSKPLGDVADNVNLIQRQILIAGALALIAALAAGYWASGTLSRRVRRLEHAAGEVAAGNFSEPIPIDSEDELGQLARAFNEMQQKLARLDQARREFIANASHELRTPIFSLGGFVELLEDEDLDEPTRAEFIATMREQVDRLQTLTTELLDLSRLDAGSLDLEREPVPLRTLARQIAGEFAVAAGRQDATIELEGDDGEEIEAGGDPERIAQILRVLVDNALTHTGSGTVITLTAAIDGKPAAPAVAKLCVVDNGAGIKRRDLEQVFDRFYTVNKAQGSGLGLAIARELAEHMQGRLEVASRPGRTIFTLTLPLADSRRPPRSADGRPSAAHTSTQRPPTRRTPA